MARTVPAISGMNVGEETWRAPRRAPVAPQQPANRRWNQRTGPVAHDLAEQPVALGFRQETHRVGLEVNARGGEPGGKPVPDRARRCLHRRGPIRRPQADPVRSRRFLSGFGSGKTVPEKDEIVDPPRDRTYPREVLQALSAGQHAVGRPGALRRGERAYAAPCRRQAQRAGKIGADIEKAHAACHRRRAAARASACGEAGIVWIVGAAATAVERLEIERVGRQRGLAGHLCAELDQPGHDRRARTVRAPAGTLEPECPRPPPGRDLVLDRDGQAVQRSFRRAGRLFATGLERVDDRFDVFASGAQDAIEGFARRFVGEPGDGLAQRGGRISGMSMVMVFSNGLFAPLDTPRRPA